MSIEIAAPLPVESVGLQPTAPYGLETFRAAATASLPDPGSDFNNDGNVDILWRNQVTGALSWWNMNGLDRVASTPPTYNVGLIWQIKSLADFNGDGKTDILWRNQGNGRNDVWIMNGFNDRTNIVPMEGVSTNFELSGTGDINNDGHTDLLWRNKVSGNIIAWYMNGTTKTDFEVVGQRGLEWKLSAVADLNGDDQVDWVWSNQNSGEVRIEFRNGNTSLGEQFLTTQNLVWQIRGTGDFNGDKKTDLLWNNSLNGNTAAWFMNTANNNAQLLQINLFNTVNPVWQPLSFDRNDAEGQYRNPFEQPGAGSSTSDFSTFVSFDLEVLNASRVDDLAPGLYADVITNLRIEYDASTNIDVDGETVFVTDGFEINPTSTLLQVFDQPLPVSRNLVNSDGPFINRSDFNQSQNLLPVTYEIRFQNAPVFRTVSLNPVGPAVGTLSGAIQMGFSNVDLDENGTIEEDEVLGFARIYYPIQPALSLTIPGETAGNTNLDTYISMADFPQEVYVTLGGV